MQRDRKAAAVVVDVVDPTGPRSDLIEHLGEFLERGEIGITDDFRDVASDGVLGRHGVHLGPGLVDVHHGAAEVLDEDAEVGGVERLHQMAVANDRAVDVAARFEDRLG